MKTQTYFARHPLQAVVLVALLILLSGSGRVFASESWPTLPMPPKASVKWIAQNMRVNGVPTRVLGFQSRVGRAEMVEYYKAHWSGSFERAPSVRGYKQSTIVAQKLGPFFMTVKVEDGPRGTSVGLISVAQIIGSRFDRSPGELTLMPGAKVISVVESDDPGKHSRQVVIQAPQMSALVSQFYQTSMVNAGWRQVQVSNQPANGVRGAGRFIVFARDGREMQLSIVEPRKGKGSTVLANLVTNGTGRDGF